MPGTPMRELEGLSWRQTDHITCGTISHVRLIYVKQTDMENSILPNQSCQINLTKSIVARSSEVLRNLARLTNVGLHSSFSKLVVHPHQVPLATHQVPLSKSKEKDSSSNEQHVLTSLKYKK